MPVLNLRIIRISSASLLTGLMVGAVGGIFRMLLVLAERMREALVVKAHSWPYSGWLAPLALGMTGAALARLMVVRFSPEAEGSGVQRVEAAFAGEVKPATDAILPVKFFGGILAIGSGLALGREGPIVQMGASLASLVSRFLVRDDEDTKIIEAASAGAGLAVAFNAPIGGCIFVFEELTSRFTPRLVLATLTAATFGVAIMRLMFGNKLDFAVKELSLSAVRLGWPFLLLGASLGVVGALYNWLIIRLLRFADTISRPTPVQVAALIGATIGLVAWFAPPLAGGGDSLTEAILSGGNGIGALAIIFAVRFFIGPWSYAARAPGGLFAPMLLLGASFGALFGEIVNYSNFDPGVTTLAYALVGMGALFSACVRAPLTGIVLTVEMTGRGDLTLGLLGGSLMAVVVAALLDSEPIYETLKRRMLESKAD